MISPSVVNLSSKTIHISAAMEAPISQFKIAAIIDMENNRVSFELGLSA